MVQDAPWKPPEPLITIFNEDNIFYQNFKTGDRIRC